VAFDCLTVFGIVRGNPRFTTIGFFVGKVETVDFLDTLRTTFFTVDEDGSSFVEVESELKPLTVSFRCATLRDKTVEVLGVERAEVAVKSRRAVIPHSGQRALNFAIAENL